MSRIPKLWLSTLCAGFTFAHAASAEDLIKSSDAILRWIPETAQNLIVVNSPLTYYLENEQPVDPESFFEHVVLGYLLASPFAVDDEKVRRVKPTEIIQTAYLDLRTRSNERKFCEVALMQKNASRDRRKLKEFRKYAKSRTAYLGVSIFKFVDASYVDSDELAVYEAIPAPGVLICASSPEYISEILQCNREGKTIQKLGPEWAKLDTSSSYWGFHKFSASEKAALGEKNAVGYNFSYCKSSLDFSVRFITKRKTIDNPHLKLLLEDGASARSTQQLNDSSCNRVFEWTYPGSQPNHWHIPTNQRVKLPILGIEELVEKVRNAADVNNAH